MYDLIIKNGTVVDPAQELNAPRDVAVQDGKIVALPPSTLTTIRPGTTDGSTITFREPGTHSNIRKQLEETT